MDKLNHIKNIVESMETDAIRFYEKGNKSAGIRYRNYLNGLQKYAKEERKNVLLSITKN